MGVRRRQRIRHSECNRQLKWFGRTRTQSMRSRGEPRVLVSVETTLTTLHPAPAARSAPERGEWHAGPVKSPSRTRSPWAPPSWGQPLLHREWLDGTMHLILTGSRFVAMHRCVNVVHTNQILISNTHLSTHIYCATGSTPLNNMVRFLSLLFFDR